MANQEHLDILKQGVEVWNRWRKEHPSVQPDLSESDFFLDATIFTRKWFFEINLSNAILWKANLARAHLIGAALNNADLREADLREIKVTQKVKTVKSGRLRCNLLSLFQSKPLLEYDTPVIDAHAAHCKSASSRSSLPVLHGEWHSLSNTPPHI